MEEEKEYKPKHKLLDACIKMAGVKTDKELAARLSIKSPMISKIRHGKLKVSSNIILAIHESLGMPLPVIRELLKEGLL